MHIRTIIMTKDGMIAAIGLAFDRNTAQVGRFDVRVCDHHIFSTFDSSQQATKGFANMLRDSLQNGWKIKYDGRPHFG